MKYSKLHCFMLFHLFCYCISMPCYAQSEEDKTLKQHINYDYDEEEKTFAGKVLKAVWGVPAETSITAMPFGLHTDLDRFKGREVPNGLHPALYFSFNYKTIDLAGFKNSFGDFSCALTYKRTWPFKKIKNFSMNVGAGIIWGYDGRLQNSENVPFRNTFLIRGDVMPVIGGQFDYVVYRKWSISVSVAPAIIIYGLRYRL